MVLHVIANFCAELVRHIVELFINREYHERKGVLVGIGLQALRLHEHQIK